MATKAIVSVEMKMEDLGKVRGLFEELKPSKQRSAYRSAASKSATKVRKSARALIPKGLGITPAGKSRPHLRDVLVQNVKTLGKGKNATVSAIVGADYKKVPTIHLVNNPVKPHGIMTVKKRTLSNLATTAGGAKQGAMAFGKNVKHPGSKGSGALQRALEANKQAIVSLYADAIRKAVAKAAAKG